MFLSNIPLSIYMIFLAALLLVGVKRKKKKKFHDDFLDLSNTKALQGFAAAGIILHHLTQTVTQYGQIYKGIIVVMVYLGVYFTGMFFFFSGYGLYTSFANKEDYLKTFLQKRLPTVLIPFYVTNTIFIIVSLIMGYEMSIQEGLLYITGLVLLNSQMWFIVEIVVLYLAFYFIFKFIKKQSLAFTAMAAFMILLTTVSLLLGHDNKYASGGAWFHGEWWYNSTWVFFVGMLIARFKTNVVSFAKKYYKVLLPVGIILTMVMQMVALMMMGLFGYYRETPEDPGYFAKFMTCLGETPAIIVFVLTFLLLTMKLQFNNPVLKFLGKIAIELYLIHNIFILYLKNVVQPDFLFMLCVYAPGIILATGIHYTDRWLIKKICDK